MRFRPSHRTLLVSLLFVSPLAVSVPRSAWAQPSKPAPKTALIASVRGQTLTLTVGSDDGAKIGQTFRVARGNAGAKIQINAVTPGESTASV
ncbi:MAG: hypothetical protein KY445_09995, partial [Armatimonadetes bacterium]|nr:hypothetical protein [Armatimonadota bacterium]